MKASSSLINPNEDARKAGTRFEMKGNTLKVYLYALKHGSCELREIQHALGFSSPSLASYHLNRLIDAGYMKQEDDGRYSVEKDASKDVIEGYSKLGTKLVPQLFFVALLFTILVGYFSFRTLLSPSFSLFLIAVSICCVGALWVETIRLWRKLVALH
jgi:DNA-binding transcriptional ArsR family regulator